MSGHGHSADDHELKQRYKVMPEIVSPLDGRVMEPSTEKLAAEGQLSELEKVLKTLQHYVEKVNMGLPSFIMHLQKTEQKLLSFW